MIGRASAILDVKDWRPLNAVAATGGGPMNRGDELEHFKTEIDLVDYATRALGFRVDQASRRSARLKKDGDVIIVARDQDGHYTYFSPLDDKDNGTIIDLVQRRRQLSLGELRRELRQWLGESPQPPNPVPSLRPESHELAISDRVRLRRRLHYLTPTTDHPLLLKRGIPSIVLAGERFLGTILADNRGNILFPHEDDHGLSGFEIRSTSFKGFSRGEKALWISNRLPGDDAILVCESPIDALSYHALYSRPHTQYASTAGGWGPKTGEALLRAIANLQGPRTVLLGFDNDEQGRRYADKCRELVHPTGATIIDALPPTIDADWNDIQRAAQRTERGR
jgi:hypothetical protein